LNSKPQNCEADTHCKDPVGFANAFAQLKTLASADLLRTNFTVANFLFSSLWQHGAGKYKAPTATKNFQRESFPYKRFPANLRKFGRNILRTPQK